MSKLGLALLALLLPLVPACDKEGEGDPPLPTIVDKSAEDAADITTEVACGYVSRCGTIEVSCSDCADAAEGGDCGGCTVEQIPMTVEECTAEVGPEIAGGFSCQPLTAEEEALVDECLANLATAECPSVEEVQDWANGAGGEPPADPLASCEVLGEILSRCYEVDSEPGNPGEPLPG